jgi:hypothetical protein
MINLLAKFVRSDFVRFLDIFSDTRRKYGARALQVRREGVERVSILLQFDNIPMFEAFLAEPEVAGIMRAARELNGHVIPARRVRYLDREPSRLRECAQRGT